VRNIYNLVLILFISLSFSSGNSPFVLTGHVESRQGIVLPNIYIQIWKNGDVINQTKTDNFGNYKITLLKTGVCKIIAGNKNKYFHPIIIKEFDFNSTQKFKQNFKLLIDKQVLQRETTKLRESYNHMMKNHKNLSYKRAFFKQFPASGYETELFFNKNIAHINLKVEAKNYMTTIFKRRVVGWSGYMMKFIQYGQKTNMKVAGSMTNKFYSGASQIIKNHPLELFKELSTSKDNKITQFFIWLFSGNEFGEKELINDFKFLSEKYKREYQLMLSAFDNHLNSN